MWKEYHRRARGGRGQHRPRDEIIGKQLQYRKALGVGPRIVVGRTPTRGGRGIGGREKAISVETVGRRNRGGRRSVSMGIGLRLSLTQRFRESRRKGCGITRELFRTVHALETHVIAEAATKRTSYHMSQQTKQTRARDIQTSRIGEEISKHIAYSIAPRQAPQATLDAASRIRFQKDSHAGGTRHGRIDRLRGRRGAQQAARNAG